ncbi:MAG TPA: aspartate aminotransferase family protein, partial [Actinomycetota bacterium]|nr:aspartate aminotransferase family protein [Actinomycetota bacterium]
TDIPGPGSRKLGSQAALSVAGPVSPFGEVFIASGRGAVVEDVDGNHLLDLVCGLGCLAVGHSHPHVVDAVKAQAERFLHTDYNVVAYEVYQQLAERVAAASGGNRRVAFFNSGAEAVENSVKVARAVTGRPGIMCFEGAFHGRTHMAMSLTHREHPYKAGFGPFSPDVHRVPYPGLDASTMDEFRAEASAGMEGGSIAAAIVEPILGEGGVIVPPDGFLEALAELCHRHGALLIVDEIQTGYGRTGRFLASQHSEADPDLILLGKSIASGLPLSAVAGKAQILDKLDLHALGGTYVGNPVACAAGLAVLDVMEAEKLIERAEPIGSRLKEAWQEIGDNDRRIKGVRGRGAMVGVSFRTADEANKVAAAAASRGVLVTTAGLRGNVVRHLPPLVLTDDELEEAIGALKLAVREC